MQEQPYLTPPGYYDVPYIYAYDGDSLADATSPQNLSLTIEQGSSFIVRRVTGLETVADKIYLRSATGAQWSTAPMHFLYDYAVVPERIYPNDSFIRFDLVDVLKGFNPGAISEADAPYPQLIFQGVKRFKGDRPQVYPSRFPYRLRPFTYQKDVVVDWLRFVDPVTGGSPNIPRVFTVGVQDYDFELCQISICRYDGADCSTDLKIQLFNRDRTAFFSNPVLLQFLQDNNNNNKYNGVFPSPPIVYEDGNEIQFNVTSMLTNASSLPITYSVTFNGMRRVRDGQ